MKSTFTNELINGQLKQVQTIRYSNGMRCKRIFNSPGDKVPCDLIRLTPKGIFIFQAK